MDRFTAMTGKKALEVDVKELKVKPLGPFQDYGEEELEPYNRCWNLLMYVSYSLSPKLWDIRFGTSKWDEDTVYPCDYQPTWMRSKEDVTRHQWAPDRKDDIKDQTPPKPPLRIKVFWNPDAKNSWTKELMAEIEENEAGQSIVREGEITVLSGMHVEEVRDLIRACLRMEDIGAQIRHMTTVPGGTNVRETEWSKVEEEMYASESSGFSFRLGLEKALPGEIIWEYRGIPGLSKPYDTPTSVHTRYSHIHDVLQKSIEEKIEFDTDIKAKLTEALRGSAHVAPDANILPGKSKTQTEVTESKLEQDLKKCKSELAGLYTLWSGGCLGAELEACGWKEHIRSNKQEDLVILLKDLKALAECKTRHGNDYEKWSRHCLLTEVQCRQYFWHEDDTNAQLADLLELGDFQESWGLPVGEPGDWTEQL
ncbi:hypothetical protein DM02DRAFT_614885 [Periconia macrospinosa]|uniref:Uncharacterized protein n=1 Tax=Periconia macrospinosa TaxID=97972 RepID=A0A2V1DR38_9PLEO|nr:hypothetical protein DM02DRAFT_614885 [Periconia macrospinosa]